MKRTQIGFIGVGAMSQAILAGLILDGRFPNTDITVVGRSEKRVDVVTQRFEIGKFENVEEMAAHCDTLILCIKPKDLSNVVAQLTNIDLTGKLVISTLAGVKVSDLKNAFSKAHIVRSIPNIAAETGTGVTLWCAAADTPPKLIKFTDEFWASVGTSLQVTDEALIDFGTPISGAAPAFLALFVEAMVDAGVYLGIPWNTASQLVLQSLKGSCDLVDQEGYQTHQVRQRVTSPGGLTATAMAQLEASGLRQAIMNAVLSGHSKTMELGDR